MIYFVLTPIYTRALPVGGNGIFTAMYANASIVNAILAFGMETTYFRYLQKRSDKRQQVYNNAFGLVIAVTLLFLIFCLLFLNPIISYMQAGVAKDHADYTFYVKCFLVILVADAFCVIPFAKIRADGRPLKYAFVKCTNILFVVLFNLFFLFGVPFIIRHHLVGSEWMAGWYRPHWVGYVFLANAAASVFTIVLLLPEVIQLKLKFDVSMYREMFVYSWPVTIASISYIINESLDKNMLKHMLPQAISDRDVGIYGTCAKIAIFLSIFVQAFRLGAEPFFFSHAKNKNSGDTYARIMNYFVITVAVITVGVVANVDILATVILGKHIKEINHHLVPNVFWEGLGVIPPLLFGYLSLGIYMNLSVWYKLSDQTKYGLYISGIGAILTIILNWVFIPKYSYMASAWISFIAYVVMMVLSYIWGQRNYPIPYNLKKNLIYIIIAAVFVYLSFYIFNHNIFIGNALFILFIAGAYIVEQKELKAILRR
ncbi:polysaccharide biosynthesis C-terminal domain-containing protein [Mucilaginibacter panaciglaebae]|uniref:Polysaccharide biosynthesis C-terminal domain-containing protein n=2 Tax=Mucilaginibacter panaciglaebae TaxID=502331 RepID=A0ABP7WVT1_9SPHI